MLPERAHGKYLLTGGMLSCPTCGGHFEALKSGKLKLDEDLPISVRAASQTGQSLRLRQGATIKTRDAILGTIIESANDAAVVLAERLGGTESDFFAR